MALIIRWVVNAFALLAIAYILPNVEVAGFGAALIAALILGVINAVIRPILLVLTLPVNILTLGLFTFILNGFLFWFAGSILEGFEVVGFWAAIFGALLMALVNGILSSWQRDN